MAVVIAAPSIDVSRCAPITDKWIAVAQPPPADSRPVAEFDVSGGTHLGRSGHCLAG